MAATLFMNSQQAGSIKLVFNEHELVANWVADKLGMQISKPYVAIGMTRDGRSLCGGAVFNHWNGSNLEMTIFTDFQWKLGLMRAVLHYIFVQAGALRLTLHVRRSNKRVRKMLHDRASFEGVARHYYGKSDDAFVYAIFPDQIRKYL